MIEETVAPVMAQEIAVKATNPHAAKFKSEIDRTKQKRDELLRGWQTSVDYRKVKPFAASDEDRDRVAIPVDWSQTKAKQAQLFSQVPKVLLTPKRAEVTAAIPTFARKLNETIDFAEVGIAMDECLPDVINKAGVAAVIVGYESRQRVKTIPKIDTKLLTPEALAALQANPAMMDSQPEITDSRMYARRISPDDFLWPLSFRGSNFDNAPWLGYSGRMPWAEAKGAFKLSDDQKDDVTGGAERSLSSKSSDNNTDPVQVATDLVEFDEIYYWAHLCDSTVGKYQRIHRLVWVAGLDKPAIDEPWAGQEEKEDGSLIGAKRLPVRVLTLTYISDEAIPPSDSEVGRAQVDELIRSRSQIVAQRDHSTPMRWFDVNRIDPQVVDALMKGTWQGMIPVNGDGSRSVGEVARAVYPPENGAFDRMIKTDLQESWQIGANQNGAFNEGERSAAEAQIVQQNFQTRIGYERARVAAFFCGIAEVLAGLLMLFGEFTAEEQQKLSAWNPQSISNEFAYTIRTDSAVLLDADQRLNRATKFLNIAAKSGYMDVEPVLREIAALSGYDPDEVIKRPGTKEPDSPVLSFRFSSEDLINPIALAMLMKSGHAPTPEELKAAMALLASAQMGVVPNGPGMTPPIEAPPGGEGAVMDDRMPDYNMADRINTRRNPGEGAV